MVIDVPEGELFRQESNRCEQQSFSPDCRVSAQSQQPILFKRFSGSPVTSEAGEDFLLTNAHHSIFRLLHLLNDEILKVDKANPVRLHFLDECFACFQVDIDPCPCQGAETVACDRMFGELKRPFGG